jgi:hypothetical protein
MLAAKAPSPKTSPGAGSKAEIAGPAAGSMTGPKADMPIQTASRFDATFALLGDNAPAIPPGQVPLPHANPHKLPRKPMVAAIPVPRQRVAERNDAVAAATEPTSQTAVGPPSPQPSPASNLPNSGKPEFGRGEGVDRPALASAERASSAMRLMSYAPPTNEQLFAPEVTGSIGNPLRDLVTEPAGKPVDDVPLPSKPPQAAAPQVKPLSKVMPEPALKLRRPHHKLTVQEKLWGPVQVASLGRLDAVGPDGLGRDKNGIPTAPYDKQTAVYVITDKKVYMPDGTVLEAHSGLGDKKDDPRFANVRMRGVTPPHVYDLKMRESLFHGVEAIRMLPMGGEDAIFGRDGILAHTYMLGAGGQSNGCVSFKDYGAFLAAFKAGKINRLAVIARLD